MPRHVQGLRWAIRAECPWPKSRPRGTKALGLAYERAAARALPRAEHNPWFKFEDRHGIGYCSPDLLFIRDKAALLLECKLTDWEEAWEQLQRLYIPVVGAALGVSAFPVVLVKHAPASGPTIVTTLAEALATAEHRPVLHWIGRGPLR